MPPGLNRPVEGDSPPSEAGSRRYEGSELDLFSHATRWKAYWSSLVSPYVGSRVLDVGAGIGATAEVLRAAPSTRWVALEPDPALSERMQAGVLSGRLPAHVEVRCGTTRNLGKDERFDTILYIDVLEHIENDAAELELAAHHLEPGGFLVILAPAHNWLYTPFDEAIGHFRRYTRRTLQAIRPQGLELSMIRYIDSAGMLASLGNRLLLRSAQPTPAQIGVWDRFLVPLSTKIDPWLSGRIGKSIVCVLKARAFGTDRSRAT